jgi:hypothetical protein
MHFAAESSESQVPNDRAPKGSMPTMNEPGSWCVKVGQVQLQEAVVGRILRRCACRRAGRVQDRGRENGIHRQGIHRTHPAPVRAHAFDGRPVITAREALDRLEATHSKPAMRRQVHARFHITDVRLASGEFETDRGRQSLPAWLFSAEDTLSTVDELALAPPSRYPVPGGQGAGQPVAVTPEADRAAAPRHSYGARVSPDGRDLTFTVGYSPDPGTDPCRPGPSDTRVELVESAHAVAYRTVSIPLPRAQPPTRRPIPPGVALACPAYLVIGNKEVKVHLDAPLGNRVLILVPTPQP